MPSGGCAQSPTDAVEPLTCAVVTQLTNLTMVRGRPLSVARLLLRFTAGGVVVTAALVALTGLLAHEAGIDDATRSAERLARVVAHGVVTPLLTPELLDGSADAREEMRRAVEPVLTSGPVTRIKVWSADGRILWSEEPRLVGRVFPLGENARTALSRGSVESTVSDLSGAENRFERADRDLLEVYVGVRAAGGERVLVEIYQDLASVRTAAWAAWWRFAPVSVGALLLLELVQVPFAWRLARRVREHQAAEALLLRAAVSASEAERRRIAGEVHDGVVQDLTGLAYDLDAERLAPGDREDSQALLGGAAARVRHSVTELRSLLVDLSPPRLPASGLRPALDVLAEGLDRTGVHVDLSVDDAEDLPRPVAELLHRAALEALRNVVTHSRAARVTVAVHRIGNDVQLTVDDDGRGFDEAYLAGSRVRGHLGLQALADRLRAAGGSLTVSSAPGLGTRILARVPLDADADAVPRVLEAALAGAGHRSPHRPLSRAERR